MTVTVNGKGLHGTIPAIASKSMAHRLLICAALSDEPCEICCETLSDDISATVKCLKALGAEISYTDGKFYVNGGTAPQTATLDCAESGSTLRFLLPVAAALGTKAKLIRRGRLSVRPMNVLTDELCSHGVSIVEDEEIMLVNGKLGSGEYTLRADVSSQYISGLLFALPLCEGDSKIHLTGSRESESYIGMTLWALRDFGITVKETKDGYEIPGSQRYISPVKATVEGDWSGAAFWLCAAALGAPVTVTGLLRDSLQGDRAVCECLERLSGEGKVLLDAADIPDLVPVLAVAASVRQGQTVIYNAGRLRFKESDRLKTICQVLGAMGANIKEREDGLSVKGTTLHPARVSSWGDHRIAMSAAIASVAAGSVTIDGAEAAAKSYPSFWEDFKRLGGSVIFE